MPKEKPAVLPIAWGALAAIYYYRVALARSLLLPFVGLVVTELVVRWTAVPYIHLLVIPIKVALYCVFAITIHRTLLLGADSVPEWGLRGWTMRETYFAAHLVVFSVMLLLAQELLGVLGLLAAVYLLLRSEMVFPGSAVDHGITVKKSWQITQPHQLTLVLLLLILVLFYVPIAIVLLLLLQVGLPPEVGSFVYAFLDIAVAIYFIAILSITYKAITEYEFGQPTAEAEKA